MEQPQKIALLTSNNGFSSYYFIRQMRAAFPNVYVICTTPKLSFSQQVKKVKSALYFGKTQWRHKFLFKYKYPKLRALLPVQNPDFYSPDINAPAVKHKLEQYKPDVICILGTKKVEDEILQTSPICLNIHGGFVPYYRGVSSPAWTTLHHNFPYLSYCIHEATNTLDQGRVWTMACVPPYFYEPFGAYTQRLTFSAIDKLIDILKDPKTHNKKACVQPKHTDAKNYRHKDKPDGFTHRVEKAFSSSNAEIYKYGLPRSNRIEKKWIAKNYKPTQTTLSPGWYIVCYHEISDDLPTNANGPKIPAISTAPKQFEEHLTFYHDNFKMLSIEEGLANFKKNKLSNEPFLTVTFDDGLSSTRAAIDLLKSANQKPTLFLNTQAITNQTVLPNHESLFLAQYLQQNPGKQFSSPLSQDDKIEALKTGFLDFARDKYLTQEDIADLLAQDKIELGSHTRTHIDAGIEDFDILKDEIQDAHQDLEALFQRQIPYFSFPFGKRANISWLAEFLAMQTASHYFSCFGGVNRNLAPGMLLRIAIHNESCDALKHLLTNQFVR